MEYKRMIVDTLDYLGVNKSYLGYDYVVYGMLLTLKDKEYATYITKSLYLDIAKHFDTSWNCVEKNIRTVINAVWNSENVELLELIFKKSSGAKKPTNKEFFRYMYEYITDICRGCEKGEGGLRVVCPVSNKYCEALESFYIKLTCIREIEPK